MCSEKPSFRLRLTVGVMQLSAALLWSQVGFADEPPVFEARVLERMDAFDADQAVAVDKENFYAINNVRITRHDRSSGEPELQWDGTAAGDAPLHHLNSGMVHDGRLYAANSSYPAWPMTSSIEIWLTKKWSMWIQSVWVFTRDR